MRGTAGEEMTGSSGRLSCTVLRVRTGAVAIVVFGLALSSVIGCGPSLPARFVLERDVGHFSYRRYQRVLDVEFPIEGNAAVGHTATYVRRSERGEPPYVNVFVTVYDHPASLTAEIRHQVQSLQSYDVAVADVGGGRAWTLDGGDGDRWVVWVSSRYVVKIGGNASPEAEREVVESYMGMYPSDLDEHGRARDGSASAGDAASAVSVEQEQMELPRSLAGQSDGTSGGESSSAPPSSSSSAPSSGGR
jgi:hypothetical protein